MRKFWNNRISKSRGFSFLASQSHSHSFAPKVMLTLIPSFPKFFLFFVQHGKENLFFSTIFVAFALVRSSLEWKFVSVHFRLEAWIAAWICRSTISKPHRLNSRPLPTATFLHSVTKNSASDLVYSTFFLKERLRKNILQRESLDQQNELRALKWRAYVKK